MYRISDGRRRFADEMNYYCVHKMRNEWLCVDNKYEMNIIHSTMALCNNITQTQCRKKKQPRR